jgi:S1-C subfamily serine protease
MRENESDSQDGWPGPYDYISPWAARDPGEAEETSADDVDQASDRQDAIAFGSPASAGGDPGRSSYPQPGSSDPWYVSGRGESGYGSYAGPGSGFGSESARFGSEEGGFGSGSGGFGSGSSGSGSGSGFGSGSGGFGSGGSGWDPDRPARRGRRRGHLVVYLTVAVLAAGIGAGLTVAFDGQGSSPAASASSGDIPSPHDNQAGMDPGPGLNAAAVERKVKPGLVDITSQLKYASETAEGTGMILSPSGLVLTNNHVIDGATEVRVALADNTSQSYAAQVVGYDYTDDVALLKLTGAAGLATVSFGNSSQVRVGIPVLALGDAQGRGGVTAAPGVISGLNRSIQASDEGSDTTEDLNNMLQTNAEIQQGDSGGALANNTGQVIGMITAANTASSRQPGGTMGFAIPIDSALRIARQIASGKPTAKVSIGLPGFLGVEVAQSNSPNPAQQARDAQQGNGPGGGRPGALRGGLACVVGGQEPGVPRKIAPAGGGALILGVLCGTAAQSRGLTPGDVILSVDGQAVTTPGSLTDITAEYHPAEVVSVTWEDAHGARHTARIKLGTGPAR